MENKTKVDNTKTSTQRYWREHDGSSTAGIGAGARGAAATSRTDSGADDYEEYFVI
jgi:hypothetical protein